MPEQKNTFYINTKIWYFQATVRVHLLIVCFLDMSKLFALIAAFKGGDLAVTSNENH